MSESGVLMMIPERKMLNEGEGLKLELTRVIRAKRERVFAAWTKPEMVMKWFAPETKTVCDVSVDLRVGGAYRIEMTGANAECDGEGGRRAGTVAAFGIYREIVPDELLRFTWNGTWHPEEETLVTVALKDVTGGTELTLTHERFATEESRAGHERGWTGGLTKMGKMFDEQV